MRKYLIRWWYTQNWEQVALLRGIIRWNGDDPTWTQAEYLQMIIGPCDIHTDGRIFRLWQT